MTKPTDPTPATVPFGAIPAGSPPAVKEWANRAVWTERMLTALEQGVRGGRWHTLIDHHRWPNQCFADLGLFSLVAAHGKLCQSLTGP